MKALLLLLTAVLAQPGNLVVRDGDHSIPLPVLVTQRGPMVRIEDGLQTLGAALIRSGSDRFRLVIGGADIEFVLGQAVAKVEGVNQTLTGPPTMFDGKLLVPLALLTDLVPRVATGYRYEAATGELRRAARPAPAPAAKEEKPPAPAAKATPPPKASAPVRRALSERVVVVDAGHGGPDRGMTGPIGSPNKIFEKDITLRVALATRDALQRAGVKVVMTRTRDTLIALADRGRLANEARGDVFVSIHVNAANPRWQNPRGARGFETYFLSEAKTDDERRVEQIENEAVRYEGEEEIDSSDPLRFILNDMKQNEYLRESSDFATGIQESLGGMHPGPNRGVKQAGFRVLVSAFMPSVLVEVGFGSNAAEAWWLSSGTGQREVGSAIATATVNYLRKLEQKGQGGGVTR